ncbi:MAG: E2/UBC family protein [Terriglobales bacterium]
MDGVELLRAHAEEFTATTSRRTEIVEAGAQVFVIIKDVPTPSGLFALPNTDLLFITDRMYPMSAMDMFWADVNLLRPDGRVPQGATVIEMYVGRQWRRFSWHRNGVWNPNRNGILDHFAFVESGWVAEARS